MVRGRRLRLLREPDHRPFFRQAQSSDIESLIKAYASFAIIFYCRPLGAALMRRSLSRTPIGSLPTDAPAGGLAPRLILRVRVRAGARSECGGAVPW